MPSGSPICGRCCAIVYEILGSATESDDVLQDSYLRWAEVDLATVRDTKSYLAQLVTRQALNALQAGARRREVRRAVVAGAAAARRSDASTDVVLAESVSNGHACASRRSTPMSERCSCCARSSGSTTTRSQAPSRSGQRAPGGYRAREHVQARRKRFEPADSAMTAELTDQFMTAASTGDVDGLMALLAPDATWTADSGGKATAARRR